MNRRLVGLWCATVMPLMGQAFQAEVGFGRQSYNTFNRQGVEAEPEGKTFATLRLDAFPWGRGEHRFGVSAAFQLKTKTRVDLGVGGIPIGSGDLEHEAYGLGLGYQFQGRVLLGAGLDYRWERLSDGDTATTYGRPWFRAQAAWAPAGAGPRPVLGVELGLPLHTTNDDVASPEAILKSLAPSFQAGLFVGVRF